MNISTYKIYPGYPILVFWKHNNAARLYPNGFMGSVEVITEDRNNKL